MEAAMDAFNTCLLECEDLVETSNSLPSRQRPSFERELTRLRSLVEGITQTASIMMERPVSEPAPKPRRDPYAAFTAPKEPITFQAPKKKSSASSVSSNGTHSVGDSLFKIKKVELPFFYGRIQEWPSFWACFEAAVHNSNAPDQAKLAYFAAQLKGEAKKWLGGYNLAKDTYTKIIEGAQQRFGNRAQLINSFYDDLKWMTQAKTAAEERRNLDAVKKAITHLRALNADTEQEVLKGSIVPKFPKETMRWAFRCLIKTSDMEFSVAELVEVLSILVGIDELVDSYFTGNSPNSRSRDTPANSRPEGNDRSETVLAGALLGVSSSNCLLCTRGGGKHRSENCQSYDTYSKRKDRFASLKLCYLCGAGDHIPQSCPYKGRACSVCGGKGHTILTCISHIKANVAPKKRQHPPVKEEDKGKFLETFSCFIISPTGDAFPVRGMVDAGCSDSYVSQDLLKRLCISVPSTCTLSVARFGVKECGRIESGNVQLSLASLDRKTERIISFRTTPCITGDVTTCPSADVVKEALPASKDYADKQIFDRVQDPLDIVIGVDYQFTICTGPVEFLPNSVVLRKSIFGWIPSGKIRPEESACGLLSASALVEETVSAAMGSGDASASLKQPSPSTSNTSKSHPAIPPSLQAVVEFPGIEQLWSLETLGIKPAEIRPSSDKAVRDFHETHKFVNGRFSVSWPWKQPERVVNGVPQPRIPENYRMCKARLRSLLERLSPELKRRYHEQMMDQLKEGIIEVAPSSKHPTTHYLPHRAVLKDDKIRVVYDGSAKTKGGECINDHIEKGPCLIEHQIGLFFGFREESVGLTADIEKAFLQILLNEVDRDCVRFLWVKDPFKPLTPDNIVVYRFARVPFGIIASPFLLNIVLQELLGMDPSNPWLQLARRCFYVDNFIKSVRNRSDALKLYNALVSRLTSASFNLRGWVSNDRAFLKAINSPLASQTTSDPVSVLGLMWNAFEDTLSVKMPSIEPCAFPTKRSILQYYASIYDPLCFFGPATLPLKLLLQKCWKEKFDWDARLPTAIVTAWQKFYDECQGIFDIGVPRRFFMSEPQGPLTLHVFCDASVKAYACCAYLSYSDSPDRASESSLIYAKVRVAPASFESKERAKISAARRAHAEMTNKAMESGIPLPEPFIEEELLTIPELELLGALIGARVAKFIRSRITVDCTVLWTDATTVLQWLDSEKVLPVFVKNRVNEIKMIENLSIRYVSTKENPADLASRGCSAAVLKSNSLWWKGPSWLGEKEWWPEMPVNTNVYVSDHVGLLAGASEGPKFESLLLPDSLECMFKTWDSAVSLFKCYNNLRFRHLGITPSSFEEYTWAEDLLILELQKKYFAKEREMLLEKDGKKGVQPQAHLGLFLRSENSIPHDSFIRCGGRLQNAPMPWGTIHPILLPRQSPLVRLLIKKLHIKNHHVGTSHLLAALREKYWVVKARALVNSVIHHCLACRAWEGGAYQLPPMAPLPIARVTAASAFLHVGVDYIGPLNIYLNGQAVKAYVCMFVCLVTRAVHLEAARDLSGGEFLLCLERFTSRRGVPLLVVSDNATNFTFVQPLIGVKVEVMDSHLDNFLNSNRIQWKFIPAYSPWHGGAYERLVSLVKRSLKKSYGFDRLDYVRFTNALCRIENIINSRPLTYVSSSEILEPLTPNHFIRLRDVNVLMELEVSTTTLQSNRQKLLDVYYYIPEVLDSFWEVFRKQYLTSLRERHVVNHKPVKGALLFVPNKGDIVLISEPNLPRAMWSAGIVRSLDHRDAIASVETVSDGKMVKRCINHLYPLEFLTSETHLAVPKSSKDVKPIAAPIPPAKPTRRKRRRKV